MACDISAGRAKACKEFNGGLKSLYLLKYVEDAFTVANGVVTAINPLVTVVYEYVIDGDGHNLAENFVSDRQTGTSVNTQTLTAILKGLDATTSHQLNLLTYGYNIAVIRDRNGKYRVVGIDDGIDFTVAQTTGSAKTELYGYTLTGVATTKELSPELDGATTTAFLALVA